MHDFIEIFFLKVLFLKKELFAVDSFLLEPKRIN